MNSIRTLAVCALIAGAAPGVHATTEADRMHALGILQQAVACDLPPGATGRVIKALKTLRATSAGDGAYTLPMPMLVAQVFISSITVSNDPIESYVSVAPTVPLTQVTNHFDLKPAAVLGVTARDTAHGRLSASVRDHKDVWLSCEITQ